MGSVEAIQQKLGICGQWKKEEPHGRAKKSEYKGRLYCLGQVSPRLCASVFLI